MEQHIKETLWTTFSEKQYGRDSIINTEVFVELSAKRWNNCTEYKENSIKKCCIESECLTQTLQRKR